MYGGDRDVLSSAPCRSFLVIITLQSALTFAILLGLLPYGDHGRFAPGAVEFLATAAVFLVPAGAITTWLLVREHRLESRSASQSTEPLPAVLSTSREWWWAVDADWRYTFSSPTSATLLGYEPAELIGRHCELVVDKDRLTAAQELITDPAREGAFSGLVLPCRHRDGSSVWVEVSGRPRYDQNGKMAGFEGTSQPLGVETARVLGAEHIRSRTEHVLANQSFTIAFQPIYSLSSWRVVGAEALARFPGHPDIAPDMWFSEAASVGLGAELELAVIEAALTAAAGLPEDIYVSLNLSPESCLDPRLAGLLGMPQTAARSIVLELTERTAVADYCSLQAALSPLRRSGVRVAVDDAGAGYSSMRHILQLAPDHIKLDRAIIAGIDADPGQCAFGAAMVGFAAQVGSTVVAEGIETEAELAAAASLGMAEGQGYLLGRPSTRPSDWAQWQTLTFADRRRPSANHAIP